jgi:hypothetical protein
VQFGGRDIWKEKRIEHPKKIPKVKVSKSILASHLDRTRRAWKIVAEV